MLPYFVQWLIHYFFSTFFTEYFHVVEVSSIMIASRCVFRLILGSVAIDRYGYNSILIFFFFYGLLTLKNHYSFNIIVGDNNYIIRKITVHIVKGEDNK